LKHSLHILFLLILGLLLSGNALSQDTIVCAGDLGTASVETTYPYNSIFEWQVEGGTIDERLGDSIVVRWDQNVNEGRITVREIGLGGCEGETKEFVVNIRRAFADLANDPAICEGESFEFSPGEGYESYVWQDGSQDSYYAADSEGLIWVQVADEYGCRASDSTYLTVHDNPDVNIEVMTMYPDQVQIGDDSVSFAAGEVEYITLDAGMWSSYNWSNGDMMSSIDVYDTDVGRAEAGERSKDFWVTVENEYGCSASDSITVTVVGKLRIPNAFTPGGDQVNERWSIPALSLYPNSVVQVFDRHGKMVFRSNGYDEGDYWDGTDRNGNKLPMDSYYYIIKLGNGEKPIYGSVTIIR
jgi:gliding motility-associated-like protein